MIAWFLYEDYGCFTNYNVCFINNQLINRVINRLMFCNYISVSFNVKSLHTSTAPCFSTPVSNWNILCSLRVWTWTVVYIFFSHGSIALVGLGLLYEVPLSLRQTTLGRTPLDKWSARRRDLYLTKHNTHNKQISMPPGGDSNPQSQQASGRRPTP
jgi:hypothetical protein